MAGFQVKLVGSHNVTPQAQIVPFGDNSVIECHQE